MYKLSICIPTFNRENSLRNCLNSVHQNIIGLENDIQVCISNNCSNDGTDEIIQNYLKDFPIKYKNNSENIGMARNIMQVASMGDGEFVWMIGDDDLFLPGAFKYILELLDSKKEKDYFYINSSNLNVSYINSFNEDFSLDNLPKEMTTFSPCTEDMEVPFLKLINPKVSFDFLGGIFLSCFRKDLWDKNIKVLEDKALLDERLFSHFDNTFPQIKVLAYSFSKSNAYLCSTPLTVCVSGVREWGAKGSLVKSFRLVEALQVYRKNGLSFWRYHLNKNGALDTFGVDLVKMLLDRENSGIKYINLFSTILSSLIYPNFYFSFIKPIFRVSFWSRLVRLSN